MGIIGDLIVIKYGERQNNPMLFIYMLLWGTRMQEMSIDLHRCTCINYLIVVRAKRCNHGC